MSFFQFLENLPWAFATLLIIIIFVVYAILGLLLVRKYVNHESLKKHHDVAGVVFANIGVLYGVLLGFTVVNVQQRFDKLQDNTEIEAIYLEQLYRDAEVFTQSDRLAIRNALIAYCDSVIHHEWPLLSMGQESLQTNIASKGMWNAYYNTAIDNPKQQTWYSESIGKLNLLVTARISRLLGSGESLGSEMWSLLILGGIVMISFMWFFGLENLTAHILMASTLATAIAFLLFLIYSLDTAFAGNVSISPEALIKVLDSFKSGF